MADHMMFFILPLPAVALIVCLILFFRHRRQILSRLLPIVMAVLIMTGAISLSGVLTSVSAESATDEPFPPDFTLTDQYGETHTLSDYRGKAVFLNFWTTWCPWCIREMPDIEELYHELGENQEEVVILGIGAPSSYDSVDEAGIIAFLEEHGWTYPVLMDPTGELFDLFGAQSLPTTWLIRPDGNPLGYIPGALTGEQMREVIQMALDADQNP